MHSGNGALPSGRGIKKACLFINRSVAGIKKQAYKILHHRSNQHSENKVCKGFLVKVLGHWTCFVFHRSGSLA